MHCDFICYDDGFSCYSNNGCITMTTTTRLRRRAMPLVLQGRGSLMHCDLICYDDVFSCYSNNGCSMATTTARLRRRAMPLVLLLHSHPPLPSTSQSSGRCRSQCSMQLSNQTNDYIAFKVCFALLQASSFCCSGDSLDELAFARFLLKDRTGGQPTTGRTSPLH